MRKDPLRSQMFLRMGWFDLESSELPNPQVCEQVLNGRHCRGASCSGWVVGVNFTFEVLP